MAFRLQIKTPESTVFDGEVDSVQLPGMTGSLGVLTKHAPMIAALDVGIVKYEQAGQPSFCVIEEGMLEVAEDATSIMTGMVLTALDLIDADRKLAALVEERSAMLLAR